jgi:hypothetical protein
MRQPAFIVATLTGSLLFGASLAGVPRTQPAAAQAAHATAEAGTGDIAHADALATAIRAQFPGHAVDVKMQAPSLDAMGPTQQEVRARAAVRIDGSAPMPVRAVALYDRDARGFDAPFLRFETTAAPQPATDALRDALAVAADRKLDAEFGGQPLALSLADAQAAPVGGRYLHLVARGTTDFGAEGRAATVVDALYDPRTGEWLRLDYALGADPAEGGDGLAYAGD